MDVGLIVGVVSAGIVGTCIVLEIRNIRREIRAELKPIRELVESISEIHRQVEAELEAEPLFTEARDEIVAGEHRYRIVRRPDGYEPQMLYTLGGMQEVAWFALTEAGVWAEPEAFSFGPSGRHFPLPNQSDARRAIIRAQRINGGRLSVVS